MTIKELIATLEKRDPEDIVMLTPDGTFTNAYQATSVEVLDNNPGVIIH